MRVSLNGCEVDLERREVHRGAEVQPLTEAERALLRYLAQRPGETVSRDELLKEVWGWKARTATRAVDNTMMRLRAKVEADAREPVHLLTVRGVGYRFEGPPPADRQAEHGLVGRDRALATLLGLLDEGGLVTVVGPGGVGKTSLARAILGGRDGVFCDLAGTDDPAAAAQLVAGTLEASGSDAIQAVAAALRDAPPGVLVLDNFEQLAASGREMLGGWAVAGRASTALLVTSRERLHLPVERVLELGPLDEEAAVTLFQQRAGRPTAAPTPDERALVAAVDCLPLAVELLAGWADLGEPQQLLAQLGVQLDLLEARDRRNDRHRSVEALLEGSWALLRDEERRALERLSVFEGGFPLEGASAVHGGPALVVLGRLVDKSLVQRRELADGTVRFSLLELVRAAAKTRLARSPAERMAAELAHARWLRDHLREVEAQLKNRDRGRFTRVMGRERANLAAAYGRFLDRDPDLAGHAAEGLGLLALAACDPQAELHRLRAVVHRVSEPELFLRLVQLEATWLTRLRRREELEQRVRAVLPEAWRHAPFRAAALESTLGFGMMIWGRSEDAVALLRGTVDRAGADPRARGWALCYLGTGLFVVGQLDEAERQLEEAVALLDAAQLWVTRDWARDKLAMVHHHLGRLEEARVALVELVALAEDGQLLTTLAERALMLGAVVLEQGERAAARSWFEYTRDLGEGVEPLVFAHTVAQERLGDLAALDGDRIGAITLWEQAARGYTRCGRTSSIAVARARIAWARGQPDRVAELGTGLPDTLRDEVLALVEPDGAPPHNAAARFTARLARLGPGTG